MRVGNRLIGPDQPPFIIAEVAQSHEGSLGNAFAFAEVARDCGADAIKFQTHIAAEESTPQEPWRVPFSRQDASRYEYWRRMEFTFQQWQALKAHCDALGIVFMSSPFSIKACDWLRDLGMELWKVASGEIRNDQLLDWISATGQPIIVSTGLATPDEAVEAVRKLSGRGNEVALLHCTTRYPTPPQDVGLNVLERFRTQLPDTVLGLSDHSGTPHPGVIACYLGGSIVEVHLTLHEKMFGPDVSSSLTPDRLKQLVQGARMAWEMRRNPVDKDAQMAALGKERSIFGRSLYTARPIARGEIVAESMLGYKKPGGGMPFADKDALVGRPAARDLPAHHMLSRNDVD
jgi:N,N'-diacetyllegionaminate synthase